MSMSAYATLNRYRYRVQSWFEPGGLDDNGSDLFAPSVAFDHDTERINDDLQLVKQKLRKHIQSMNDEQILPHSFSYAAILGQLNLIDHRLGLLENKLGCVNDVKSICIELGEIGESSTDGGEFEVAACQDVNSSIMAATTMDLPFGRTSLQHKQVANGMVSPNNTQPHIIQIRIKIPDQDVQKCMSFQRDQRLWLAKTQVLNSIAGNLQDGINYGFYQPPAKGKAGKFLDEERALSDYPLPGSMPILEFKYKRRVYKQMKLDLQQVKRYHTKANLRMFMDAIRNKQVDKVEKMLEKFMDPNFHEESSGETPLTQAASLEKSEAVILALISGGAHLDFRNKKGLTAVHLAVLKGHVKVLETLLDLRASANYQDLKGVTPLYMSVLHDINPDITEVLLKDQAEMNVGDDQGWREIHQAARYGRLQHLEHLLFYGAEIDIQNEAGNTALHVCSLYNQDTAARTLLFRGIDRHIKNKASQTAFQVAIVANNFDIAELIRNFSDTNVVPFQEIPTYSKRKRFSTIGGGTLHRTNSEPYLERAGSRMSLVSNNSNPEHQAIRRGNGSLSNATMVHHKMQEVGPGKLSTAILDYTAQEPGELSLRKGDEVEVINIGEYNFWQGRVGPNTGWFPAYCISKNTIKAKAKVRKASQGSFNEGIDFVDKLHSQLTPVGQPRIVFVERGKKGFGFVLRGAKSPHGPSVTFTPTEDFPALQYLENVDKNSPADKAGLKKGDFILEINGEDVTTSPHQYVVSMVKTSPDTIVMKVVTLPESKTLAILNSSKNATLKKNKGGKVLAPQRRASTTSVPTLHPRLNRRRSEDDPLPKTPVEYSSATLPRHLMIRSRSEVNPSDLQVAQTSAVSPESNQPKVVASIKKRPTSQKINPDALKDMYHRQGAGSSRAPGAIKEESFLGRPPMPTPPAQYSSQTIARISTTKGLEERAERHAVMQQMRDEITSPPTSRHRRSPSENSSPVKTPPHGYASTMANERTVSDPVNMGFPPPPQFSPSPPPPPTTEPMMSSMYASVGDFPPLEPPPPPPPPPPSDVPPPPDVNTIPVYAGVQKQHLRQPPPPPPPPPPEPSSSPDGGGSFADTIAAAAAKREKRIEGGNTAFDMAMAAKDNSPYSGQVGNINRNQNAETQHSALQAAVARRKSQMESGRCLSIEEKIQKSKEAKASLIGNPDQDLMAAIAKRRTVVEQQSAVGPEPSPQFTNQITSAAGIMQNKLVTKPKPVRDTPVASLSSLQSAQSDSPGVLLIPPSVTNIKQTFEKSKKPPVALPPVCEGQMHPFPPPPDYPLNSNEDNQNFGAILTRFNTPQGQNRLHRQSPPSGGRSAVVEVVSPAHGQLMPRREGSSDTSSVVSSGSSASTLSTMSMSTEPSTDMFDGGDEDFPKKNNTVKSTSSSTSSSTVTSNSSWTRRSSNGEGNINQAFNRSSSSTSYQHKSFTSWTPLEVGAWLSSLNLNEHRDTFINNDISGELLSEMTKEELVELGVSSMGHRMSILKAVKKMSSN